MSTLTQSRIEKVLAAGQLAVTSECGPPRSANMQEVDHKIKIVGPYVDAINCTDNQTAVVRISSLAACIRIKQLGFDPVLQMTTRDRNRIGLQADLLGAGGWDINNVLCLTGDHQSFGDHPSSANVFDLDSTQLIKVVKTMRDEKKLMSGFEMDVAPNLFIGCAENPFADPFEIRVLRTAKKIAAGAQFVQTQCVYNMDKFKTWMKGLVDMGLTEKCAIFPGITPMKSVGMAKYMKAKVPGMDVPDDIIKRLQGVPKDKVAAEGITMAVEQIQELKECAGVRGFHIMAIEWEEKVPEIVERAGLYPRPNVN